MAELLGVRMNTAVLKTTKLTVKAVTPTQIFLEFDTLSGNQPNTYGNFVALWQNQNQIPWNQSPLKQQSVSVNTQYGSMAFDGLEVQNKSYIIGYSVGTDVTSICATSFVPVGGTPTDNFSTSISIEYIGTDAAIINYTTPAGNRPRTNKNWVGLWEGAMAPYTGSDPLVRKEVDTDNAQSSVAINGFKFKINTTYTLAYFSGPTRTNMACTLTFNTSDPM